MKTQQLNRTLFATLLLSGVMGMSSQAHALNITPSFLPGVTSSSNSTLSAAQVASAVGFSGTLALVYKQDLTIESGNAAGFYTTTFNTAPSSTDFSSATIAWNNNGSIILCGDCYLVVKDGNNTPQQYIFNISTWNGQEALNLSGFWPSKGQISSLTIFNNAATGGGTIAAIPEASTYAMMLAGLSLVGWMGAARRKSLQAAT